AMPVGLSSPTMATTRGRCSTTLATRTSSTRSGTPRWRPTVSRTFGEADLSLGHLGAAASGRRQARDDFRFPLTHVAVERALSTQGFDRFQGLLYLLVRHVLHRIAVLDLVLARHQQSEDLEIGGRLGPAHLRNGLLPMHGEISQQRANYRLAQAVTRATQSSARVA